LGGILGGNLPVTPQLPLPRCVNPPRCPSWRSPIPTASSLARSGQALSPDELGLILDWPIDRVCAAQALTSIRPMPVGVDAYGQYFITLPGRRRLWPHTDRDADDGDDNGEGEDGDAA
jgi:hypothetical protein